MLGVGDVADDARGLDPFGAEVADGVVDVLLLARGDDDGGALEAQAEGDREADPLRRRRHDRHLPLQPLLLRRLHCCVGWFVGCFFDPTRESGGDGGIKTEATK